MISIAGIEAARKREATEARSMVDAPLTETGNAERFAWEHRRSARYCRPMKSWIVFNGKRWKIDATSEVERLVKETIRGIGEQAAKTDDDGSRKALLSWAVRSESAKVRDATLRLAQSEEGIPITPDRLDRDPMFLNVQNGTIDLRTGALRPHEQRDFITKLAPVEFTPAAECPTWDRFLEQVMGGNRELIEFLQRMVGYILTGDVSAEAIFFHIGTGRNGKSTFVGTLQEMLGDYAASINSELLLASRNNAGANRASPDVMRLCGVRLAVCSETEEGRTLSAAQVKRITSTDRIAGRDLHKDASEFRPTHKTVLATNHRPRVRSADLGTWRRIFLVPWSFAIPEADQDPHLKAKMLKEFPGILAWAVRGCLDWQKRGGGVVGLAAPDAVTEATRAYRSEEDVIASFLADRCELERSAKIPKGELFAAYLQWATDNKENDSITSHLFGSRMLEQLGPGGEGKSDGVRFWKGIRLA